MSLETGQDVQLGEFGGTLTEIAPSNMPAGGSPRNLNVEFFPGMVRTRGGLQPQQGYGNPSIYADISGGPWQVRWVDDYATAPEDPSQMVLLVNPTLSAQGIIAIGGQVIGSVYGYGAQQAWSPFSNNPGFAGPAAKGVTQFGRKYLAISDGRYGYDVPRQWDGANYDRVSQCGPGQAPTVTDGSYPAGIPFGSPGINPLGNAISGISESGGICTATCAGLPYVQVGGINYTPLQPGDYGKIVGTSQPAYNTVVQILSVDYETFQVTFQGASGSSSGGTFHFNLAFVFNLGPLTLEQQGRMGVGAVVQVAGTSVGAYNTTMTVRIAPAPIANTMNPYPQIETMVLVLPTGALDLGNATSGTIAPPSHITQGLRQCSVAFITRQGYITRPAPPFSWNTAGNLLANISNIPTGPSNVVARLLIFTPYLTPPAATGTFYSIRKATLSSGLMQINDNTTTTLTGLDFSDSDLIAGFNAQYLYGLHELGCCAGCFAYASRMFWWGELNMMQDFLNMEFNGGWQIHGGTGGGDLPLGWTSDLTYGASGQRLGLGGVWQDAYRITGSGAGGPQGMITQPAAENWLGNTLLEPTTDYSIRVTARAANPADQLMVDFYIPGEGEFGATAFLNWGDQYSTQIAVMGRTPTAGISNVLLRLYAQSLAAGHTIDVDRIEICPTKQPVNYTVLWASYPSDPESFDGVTGLVQPIYTNGQAIRTIYGQRDSMYIVCGDKGSTFVTKDTGGEPATWTVDPVSGSVGCCGVNAAAAGEDWEVKVNRYGLYLYLGKEPAKISQEIQTLWNREGVANIINWQYGYKVWTAVDLLNKRIYVGAPVGAATEVNTIFVMDYNAIDTSEEIVQYATLRMSVYSGRRIILEQGRKWTVWSFATETGDAMTIPYGGFVEQPGSVARFLLAGAADNNVYVIDPANRGNDNGVGCTSSYAAGFFPAEEQEQMLQLRAHMHGFSFARMYVQGSGKMQLAAYHNSLGDPNPTMASVDLSNPALKDAEEPFNDFTAERYALEWTTKDLGSWFQMERLICVVEPDPNGLARGSNLQ